MSENKVQLPSVIFGTSTLGNMYVEMSAEVKQNLLMEYLANIDSAGKPCFDSAGKYGAGLALESLGIYLKNLDIKQKRYTHK